MSEAARTIATMPARFTRYPNAPSQVFTAVVGRTRRTPHLALDSDTLAAFGSLSVPGHVWQAMQRLSAWIDPVLMAEWARLMRIYAERQGRHLTPGVAEAALAWVEPVRDVRTARDAALRFLHEERRLRCIWSDRPLTSATLDIDHCLPWSAWPCGDLWNLLPTHRITNQREKRDLLPSAAAMAAARPAILGWWEEAWQNDALLRERFGQEAGSALPGLSTSSTEAVYEGLAWRRLRLRQDHQLVEWTGKRFSQTDAAQ